MAGRGFLRAAWAAYEQTLQRRPVATQAATSAALWACGDVASQKIEGAAATDWARTGKSALFGGVFMGPVGHFWYLGLERWAARRFVPGSPRFILTKIGLDELAFGPVHVLAFFAFMTFALGGGWEDVKAKVRHDFLSTYACELAFWPAFQAANFSLVPVRHQLLAVNTGCLLDATFLCWIQSQRCPSAQDDWTSHLPPWLRPSRQEKLGEAEL